MFTPSGLMSCQRKSWGGQGGNLAVLMLLLCFRPGNAHQQFADAELTQAFLRLSGGRLTQAADVGTESSNAIPWLGTNNSSSPEDTAATCLTPLAGSVPVPLISWHPAARMPSGSSLCAEQPKRIAKPNLQIPFSILFPSTNANSCNLCLNHTASAGKAGLGSRCQAVLYPVQSCWLKTF